MIIWSINCPKRSLQLSHCVSYFVRSVLMSSGCTHESRGMEIKNNTKMKNILMKNNISLIIQCAIGWGGGLSSYS